jgi:hypothetical protein
VPSSAKEHAPAPTCTHVGVDAGVYGRGVVRSPEPDEVRPTWPRYALAGLAAWFALTVLWAGQPVTDQVPTGMAVPPGEVEAVRTFEEITCHSVFSASDQPAEPLPALEPPREYTRPPCEGPHGQNRLMFGIDVVFALVVGTVLVRRIQRDRRPDAPTEPVAAATSPAEPPAAAGSAAVPDR